MLAIIIATFAIMRGIDTGYKEHLLNVDDYVALYETFFKNECWNGVTLSGGEPLIFQDIDALIKKLSEKGANINYCHKWRFTTLSFSSNEICEKIKCFNPYYGYTNV